ncbi:MULTISPECIES: diguanylate cyclase [Novosphingobium]|uniref:sensor domain-containing diguanylate cyclase n=1 Tax=Novosphingobium TaxID=165696 RepID=UPI0003B622E3|nr:MULTISPECIES: diguanylate cyclase [Novosphingobium]PTR11655.1 PAS domain S-box-containing protein/diguanylate cyclase (GGDEF)-like protein [Novosphingobium sp. GV055]PUB04695.1 PAS domain S-box-containing protein/diguanylate cyclase (GGDEF)-like protein [Novosphingobium sp. GV061]PUB21014.1 PAS domain S-box-containing protein/diguanylate cyclase (GGDEF)-like protein [Novosphingobium sp. GV079]PUB42740.1 PAS domain S-box-containing protein/diguanylate cyclase (GGDEF)-like protein [Novosphingo
MQTAVLPRPRLAITPAASLRAALVTALAFFISAFLAIEYSRLSGGVAMVWVSNAVLASRLNALPTRVWPATIAATGVASWLVTGLFGLGWLAAPAMMVINLFEGVVAAAILRRLMKDHWPQDTAEWMAGYSLGIGLFVPVIGAMLAAVIVWLTLGQPMRASFVDWLVGHSLGLLIFLPAGSLLCLAWQTRQPLVPKGNGLRALLLIGVMIVLTIAVFSQIARPLLLFPLLLVLFGAVWANAIVALTLPIILATVGGLMTVLGHGPIADMQLAPTDLHVLAGRLQFFQVYLGITVLAVLPVVAEQERRRRRMLDLANSEARYRLLSDHVSDVIIHMSQRGTIRYASPAITQLTGHVPEQLHGVDFRQIVTEEHRAAVAAAWNAALASPGEPVAVEFLGLPLGGPARWFETHFRAVTNEKGEIDGLVCVTRDIAQRKRIEEDLSRAALTDPLTGIPNRRAFFETAERVGALGVPSALAVVDIDYFKQVNDRYGHAVGDRVLRAFAEAAVAAVRSTDFVARIGGEEFAVLLPDTELVHAEKVCQRLAKAVNALAVDTPQGPVKITISAGIAALGSHPDAALAAADSALYRAKAEGRARLRVAA